MIQRDGVEHFSFATKEQERLILSLFNAFLDSSHHGDAFGHFCFWNIHMFDGVKQFTKL
jgi:hypothetical protein